MKKFATTTLVNSVRTLGVLALFAFTMVGTSNAASITKSFEIGEGTGQSQSHFRTFVVPCGLDVTAKVTFSRLGDPGVANDVPIIIELRKPGATAEEDGPIAAQVNNINATRTEQNRTLSGTESNRGCTIPWRVRVKHNGSGAAPNAVKGNITVTFNDAPKSLNVEGGLISLNKGISVTKNLAGSGGLDQGIVEITANWNHAIGPVPGPLPVKLKFELLPPNSNQSVRTVEAYSSNEARSGLTRFKLTYQVTEHTPGQWRIRITNNTNDDTMNIDPKVKFTPDCPN